VRPLPSIAAVSPHPAAPKLTGRAGFRLLVEGWVETDAGEVGMAENPA